MRIATWNVNSLKARLEKVEWWLEQRAARRAADAGDQAGRRRGAARCPSRGRATSSRTTARAAGTASPSPAVSASPTWSRTSASRCDRRRRGTGEDDEPLAEARMIAATCGGVRVVSLYAPNGRELGSPFYAGQARVVRAPSAAGSTRLPTRAEPLVLGGDLNVAPDRRRRLGPGGAYVGTRTSRRPSGRPSSRSSTGASWTPTACIHPEPGRFTLVGLSGGQLPQGTWACASITCS